MLFTLSLVTIISIIALFFYKPIHKYKFIIYIISLIIALSLHEDGNYITYGYTGLSFFIVVMYSGVLDKSTLRKRLFQVRAEYAVIGTIFIFPHMLGYIEFLLEDLRISDITLNYILGLLTIFVIIPLFATSFQFIRKKMGYKLWKKLHQYAYLFYLLVGLHLITINNERQILYMILFGSYGFLKLIMIIKENYQKRKKLKLKNGTS